MLYTMNNQIRIETIAMIDNLNQYLRGMITEESVIEYARDYHHKLTIG